MKNKKALGFTLIELLISISIMAILSRVLFSAINTSGLQAKARDSQRIGDLKKIQVALELYFADYRKYPLNATTALAPYLAQIPKNPKPVAAYSYRILATQSKYVLYVAMEKASSNATGVCTSLPNWTLPPTVVAPANCYGVQNP